MPDQLCSSVAEEGYLRECPDGIVIVGEISERQVLALRDLWGSWTAEKGVEFQVDVWCRYMAHMIRGGRFMPLVAFDGEKPVGMVECQWAIDPFDGKKTGYGDHAYVLPKYRKGALFTEMVAVMAEVADAWKTEAESLPVAMDAQFLIPLYESYGFKVSGTLMRRTHD